MKQCKQCNAGFEVTDADRVFYEKVSPVFGGKKYLIPEPTLCPNCRQQRRLAWRNERTWYRHECDFCKKNVVSLFPPDALFPVYCQECWWGDKWDPIGYGMEFDFKRSFFEQFADLQRKVPRLALFNMHSDNSEFTNHSSNNRNCYMGVATGSSEDCFYGHWVVNCKNVMDAICTDNSQQCYETIYCITCYETFFSQYCEAMRSSWFCFECKGCENCIGCTGLQHKKFHVYNQPVSEEEFHQFRERMLSDPAVFREVRARFEALKAATPRRATRQINCIDCSGNDLVNCKGSDSCFNCHNLEDCKYIYDAADNKNAMDNYEHGWLYPAELIYECHGGMVGFNLRFCNICSESRDLLYCDGCMNTSANLFGCIGLRHKNFCILNKQYTKEQYETMLPKILEHMKSIQEWGEFFPTTLSPFAYNETPAMEYYPLNKEQVLMRGWRWRDKVDEPSQASRMIPAKRLPDRIQDIPDDILQWAIQCEATGRLFRIIPQELKFYRQHRLPVPRLHPDERHHRRMKLRPGRTLYNRVCQQCGKAISTTYSPESSEVVYCEACYLKAVY